MPVFLGSCAFLGGVLAVALSTLWLPSANAQRGAGKEVPLLANQFEWVARKVAPSVVALEAKKPPPRGKTRPIEESGSGVLTKLSGLRGAYVLTNNHVIADARRKQITISLGDGRIFHPERVWADPESDVAVLGLGSVRVPLATLGNSDRVSAGQWVLAFGSPFGLHQTVTHGIISARERGQVSLGTTIRIKDFLQTDAAINPGSSGGPLVNLAGEVIGINTAIASPSGSSSGVAFSIPINLVQKIADELINKGKVTRGYLGLQVAAIFEPAEALRLGLGKNKGALVEKIYAGTPAARAGLRPDDVILSLDGVAVRNENQFINRVSALRPGQRVRMQIWRGRRTLSVDAVIGDWNEAQSRFGLQYDK